MPQHFDAHDYWLKRGESYREETLPTAYHQMQEQFLVHVLQQGGLPMGRVLELGCGFGRITRRLAENFPEARITAFDLSATQCANARQHCAGLPNVEIHTHDFCSAPPLPGGGNWDTAVAVEVFLHHPAPLLCVLVPQLANRSRFLVNIDWSEPWPWPAPEHVWLHDYSKLYTEAGLRCVTFVLPQKVAGLQQRLFVAGRELPEALVALAEPTAPRDASATQESTSPPPVADWLLRRDRAIAELRGIIPAGSTVILVNNDEWGCEAQELPTLRVWPFLERAGRFWGPPGDDAEAVLELTRLRANGARYLAIAWNAFWWLEHFRAFGDHLRQRTTRLQATDDIIIHQL